MDNQLSRQELTSLIEKTVRNAVTASVTEAMTRIQSDLNKLTDHVTTLDNKLANLGSDVLVTFSEQATQITNLETQLSQIAKQSTPDSILVDHNGEHIVKMGQDILQLKNENLKQCRVMNDIEQSSRSLNLRISGLKVNSQTAKKEVASFLREKLNVPAIQEAEISKVSIFKKKILLPSDGQQSNSHKTITSEKPQLLVTFKSSSTRDEILFKRRMLKGTQIGITEDLTPTNSQFLYKHRTDPRIGNMWFWMGKIYFTLQNSNVKRLINPFRSLDEQLNATGPSENVSVSQPS